MKYTPLVTLILSNSRLLLLALFVTVLSSACESVKPYQRAYLNDEKMKPGLAPCESLDQNVFSYREGSLVTGGKKTKGGCGCN